MPAKTRWYEYPIRFVFGGAVTMAAGLLGRRFGPLVGGLFLAFPAILPATLTLVKDHDGREQAADSAAGAACGALGLLGFAACVWLTASRLKIALVLALAAGVWLALSAAIWLALLGRRPR
jgi:uncharacterized membrane protein (GlpM family)